MDKVNISQLRGIDERRVSRLLSEFGGPELAGVRFFSAPGRVEIGGNHTDHQHGRVLAAAVDYCMLAAAVPNGTDTIRINSLGFGSFETDINTITPSDEVNGTSKAFVMGVADYFAKKGFTVSGFDAVLDSDVPAGGSMSSSACFGVLIGAVLNGLFNGGEIGYQDLAMAARYAENEYFGKPCGLMDQMASACGGFVFIDFKDESAPAVEKVDFDFEGSGYTMCILNSKGSHAELTDQYASIPAEMYTVARSLGRDYLREVDPEDFYASIGRIRGSVSDRAIMRAMHFFEDDVRAEMERDALKASDIDLFLSLINESGRSSQMSLENVSPEDPSNRSLSLSIALARHLLGGKGACRVQGGGFAGTAEAFIPDSIVDDFTAGFEAVFGTDSVLKAGIRRYGAVEVEV